MKNILKFSLIVATSIFIGCGGSGSSAIAEITISGKVIDGYVKNAKVCVDLNNNFNCDENEPFTYSDENGNYSLKIENKSYILISTGGIDTETNSPAVTMYSNTTYKNITPLTSLAVKYGEDAVANYYNIDKTKIAIDPMQDNEIKNIVKNIVDTKLSTSKYILDTTTENTNTSTYTQINDTNNTTTEETNTSVDTQIDETNSTNLTENAGDENIPPQIIGDLTPPSIGE